MFLEHIHSPNDLRTLNHEQMHELAREIRQAILTKTSQDGGHIGPNLGVVELTIALHYVFASPEDKIVFDVSHQSYPHKMLTGRAQAFLEKRHYHDVSGFTSPLESEHDQFTVGHTSTSIALALGLAQARDLQKQTHNVIALIGDGSLSGGEAFEGLDLAGAYKGNFIIIVNDNDHSIAPNQGGVYKNLKELRETKGTCAENYFKDLGLSYAYVDDGHNLKTLIETFQKYNHTQTPVVIHVHTTKGKGYAPAEKNPELFHSLGRFNLKTGNPIADSQNIDAATLFGKDTHDIISEAIEKDATVIALNAATPGIMGFGPQERRETGKRFLDVGIAEPAAVSLAAGLAKGGAHPVFAVRSSFVQRAYDQIAQDVCIDSLPVTMIIFTGSVYAMHDVTHQGLADIPLLSSIPNLNYLCPASPEEYQEMLTWSLSQHEVPVAIKLPGLYIPQESNMSDFSMGDLSQNNPSAGNPFEDHHTTGSPSNTGLSNQQTPFSTYQIAQKGSRVALLGLGTFFVLAQKAAALLEKTTDIHPTIINPRFASGVDTACLEHLKQNHELVVTLEDGRIEGGFGQKIATYYSTDDMQVLVRGLSQKLLRKYDVEELLRDSGLTAAQIVSEIQECM